MFQSLLLHKRIVFVSIIISFFSIFSFQYLGGYKPNVPIDLVVRSYQGEDVAYMHSSALLMEINICKFLVWAGEGDDIISKCPF